MASHRPTGFMDWCSRIEPRIRFRWKPERCALCRVGQLGEGLGLGSSSRPPQRGWMPYRGLTASPRTLRTLTSNSFTYVPVPLSYQLSSALASDPTDLWTGD